MWFDGTLDLRAEAAERTPEVGEPGGLRDAVIGTWRGRMINEWMSSFVFASLAEQMDVIGDAEGVARCRAFAAEEREHGALCGAVVRAVGGEAIAPAPPPSRVPEHPRATRRAAVARNVISIGCMSETVAVALIGAERLEMPDGPLRDLLTKIWADEVGHARFAWSWLERELPRFDEQERASIDAYLPWAFGHLEAHELEHLPLRSRPPIEGRVYGLCSGGDARSLFFETVAEVIVPNLQARGLCAQTAWNERRVA